MVDGTHRISGDFIPTATESCVLYLHPKTPTSGTGFTFLSYFIYYYSVQSRHPPTPILGPEGATFATNSSSIVGATNISGPRSFVTIFRQMIQGSNFRNRLHVTGGAGQVSFNNAHLEFNKRYVTDGVGGVMSELLPYIQYGERTGVGVLIDSTKMGSAAYDQVNGMAYTETVVASSMPTSTDFGVGNTSTGLNPIGLTAEVVLFFDVALTQAQIEEIVQRVF